MTKIGSQQGEFASKSSGAASEQLTIGSKNRFESSLKRSASSSDAQQTRPQEDGEARLAAPKPIGLGQSQNSGSKAAPATYDLTKSFSFNEISGLVAGAGGQEAAKLSALAAGIQQSSLPTIAVIGSQQSNPGSQIVAVGKTIFIPAPVFAAWNDAGQASPESARQFNQAFSKALGNSRAYNS